MSEPTLPKGDAPAGSHHPDWTGLTVNDSNETGDGGSVQADSAEATTTPIVLTVTDETEERRQSEQAGERPGLVLTTPESKGALETNTSGDTITPIDPTTLSLRRPLPTTMPTRDVSAEGVSAPTYQDSAGNRLSLSQVAQNVAAASDPVAAVAALISREDVAGTDDPIIRYEFYGNLANARPTVADAWTRGHAECDGIMSIGAYLLSQVDGYEDVVVAQSFSRGGWHNVIIFFDETSQNWTVVDYQSVVTLSSARSREEALRQYFRGNSGVSVLYRVDDPNDRPVALYHVRSDHNAMIEGGTMLPGLGLSMTGIYGTMRGVNDMPGVSLPGHGDTGFQATTGLDGIDARFDQNGTRVHVATGHKPGSLEPDRAGVAVTTATGEHTAAGGKVLFHRNPGANTGSSLMMAGEWWRIRGGNFLGIVTGANMRVDVLDRHGDPITTVAPFVAVTGGMTHTLVDNETVTTEAFWNLHGRINVPLVLEAGARAEVEDASGGLSPGGWIDPGGLASNSGLGGNAGLRVNLRLSDNWSARGQIAAHTTLTDPTLAPISMYLPVRGSVDTQASVHYQDGDFGFAAGGMATLGSLYDRDVRGGGWAGARLNLLPNLDVDLSLSGGQYVSGAGYFDARTGLDYAPGSGPWSLRLDGGTTVLTEPHGEAAVIPRLNLGLGRAF